MTEEIDIDEPKLKKKRIEEIEKENYLCAICNELMIYPICTIPCQHFYCSDCYKQYGKTDCPTCRTKCTTIEDRITRGIINKHFGEEKVSCSFCGKDHNYKLIEKCREESKPKIIEVKKSPERVYNDHNNGISLFDIFLNYIIDQEPLIPPTPVRHTPPSQYHPQVRNYTFRRGTSEGSIHTKCSFCSRGNLWGEANKISHEMGCSLNPVNQRANQDVQCECGKWVKRNKLDHHKKWNAEHLEKMGEK